MPSLCLNLQNEARFPMRAAEKWAGSQQPLQKHREGQDEWQRHAAALLAELGHENFMGDTEGEERADKR